MSELVTAARPYARAFFEFAQTEGDLAKRSEQIVLMAAIASDPAMRPMLDDPRLSKQELAERFLSVCGDSIDKHAGNLVKLLAENGKLIVLPEIAALYEQFKSDSEGVIEAEVVSAMEISKAQEAAITKSLKKRLGRDVVLSTRIDEGLMGGAIIRAGDLVIDGSLKGRVTKASTALSR